MAQRVQFSRATTVEELASYFDVSTATIRRDVKLLSEQGTVVQTVGGKILPNPGTGEVPPSFHNSSVTNFEAKLRIAEYCTNLVNERDEILIGPGTTAFLAGRIFTGISDRRFRIITNSLELATSASSVENVESIILGGTVYENHSTGFFGQEDYLSFCHKNHKLILGADGIDPDYGITLFDQRFLSILRDMVAASRDVIVTADSAKLGKVYSNKICELNAVTTLVTDNGVSQELKEQIERAGVMVVPV
ncbi:MAG: DeoR/GlpR family DNA-binding transcription regulator [Spirochaetaceae bacterium]